MSNYGIIGKNSNNIRQWLNEGISAYKIAKKLGCAQISVLRYIKKNNLTNHNKCKVDYNNLLKDKKEEAITLYQSGLSQNEVAKQLGFSSCQICQLLDRENILKRDWRYTVDEKFFDKIDSEIKAYTLGWFYSKGYVSEDGKMRIQIQQEDAYILEIIKDAMQYDGPLYYIPAPKRFPHRKPQVALSINRKTLAHQLMQLNCVSNKSCILKFPTFKQVPKKWLSHFIRGVFDGYGSINLKSGKYLHISITACESFIQPLRNYLLQELSITTKHYFRYDHTNTMTMMTTKSSHSVRLCEWMYQVATVYLTRKFDKYQQYLALGV